jgi:hypothetical protein
LINLPDAEALRKLTLRGMAAYAARSARRGTESLRGIIEDEIIDKLLLLAEELAYSPTPNRSAGSSAALAAATVAKAMGNFKTEAMRRAGLCLTRTAMVTISILDAIAAAPRSVTAERYAALAASEAAQCARHAADALGGGGVSSEMAISAACSDYAALLKYVGARETVVFGEPIPASDSFWQSA